MSLEKVMSIRSSFMAGDKERDKSKRPLDTVERYTDIPYGSDSVWQLLDLYVPKKRETEKLPVIVSIHGGGWVYGSKAIYQYYGQSMAERGFAFVNFTYRLAPEFKFPSALIDANLVMDWIVENAEEFHMDLDNVFVVGDSAGGHYTGLYGSIYTNPEYAKQVGIEPNKNIKLKGVGLHCGLYQVLESDGHDDELFEELLPGGLTEEGKKLIDVPSHMTSNFPPAYIFSANKDFLIDQAPFIKEKLDSLGVKNEMKIYGDENTELFHVFHVDISLPGATECNDDEAKFFKSLVD